MMPPFVVFPTNRIAHFVEVSLYLFYLAQQVNLESDIKDSCYKITYFMAKQISYNKECCSIKGCLLKCFEYIILVGEDSEINILDKNDFFGSFLVNSI